jgi:hypothetical protein
MYQPSRSGLLCLSVWSLSWDASTCFDGQFVLVRSSHPLQICVLQAVDDGEVHEGVCCVTCS